MLGQRNTLSHHPSWAGSSGTAQAVGCTLLLVVKVGPTKSAIYFVPSIHCEVPKCMGFVPASV